MRCGFDGVDAPGRGSDPRRSNGGDLVERQAVTVAPDPQQPTWAGQRVVGEPLRRLLDERAAGAGERAHGHVSDGLRQRRRRPPGRVDAELAFGLEDDHVVVLGERPRR